MTAGKVEETASKPITSIPVEAPQHWHHATSWDEIGPWTARDGLEYWALTVGEEPNMAAPRIGKASFAAGVTVEPHSHECDYVEIILEGSEQVTRRWYHAGDIRLVKAGTVYGPLVAGPEGVTKLIVFARGDGSMVWPRGVTPGHA